MSRFFSRMAFQSIVTSSRPVNLPAAPVVVLRQGSQYSTRISADSGTNEDTVLTNKISGPIMSTRITRDSDTHEDFFPSEGVDTTDISMKDSVSQDVKRNPVMIYMKGLPAAPQCGFSALAVKVLRQHGVSIGARDILQDPKLKQSVKAYSNWPTFPQIFIHGEFVGGSDIILNMHQNGELEELLKDIKPDGDKEAT